MEAKRRCRVYCWLIGLYSSRRIGIIFAFWHWGVNFVVWSAPRASNDEIHQTMPLIAAPKVSRTRDFPHQWDDTRIQVQDECLLDDLALSSWTKKDNISTCQWNGDLPNASCIDTLASLLHRLSSVAGVVGVAMVDGWIVVVCVMCFVVVINTQLYASRCILVQIAGWFGGGSWRVGWVVGARWDRVLFFYSYFCMQFNYSIPYII